MNLVLNNSITTPSISDETVESEQFVQLTRYTRSHSGGQIDYIEYIAASKGKASVQSWIKNYLSEDKEDLYLRALRNLFRKLDFIELNQLLDSEEISENEYDEELDSHEEDYLIPAPSVLPTAQQIIQISDIIKRLGREKKISVDEVSEIFSLKMDSAIDILNKEE